MPTWLTPGIVTGLLGFFAVIAGAFGKPALQTFLADPSTAQGVLTVVGSGLTLVASALRGLSPAA